MAHTVYDLFLCGVLFQSQSDRCNRIGSFNSFYKGSVVDHSSLFMVEMEVMISCHLSTYKRNNEMYTIHRYLRKAKCEYAGRETEAVEISSEDGTLDHAVLCFSEFQRILRFRQAQEEKKQTGSSNKQRSVVKKTS